MSQGSSTVASEALRNQIVVADEARIAAAVHRDRGALEDILSDQLIYVHSSGREETKQLYIDQIANGAYDYRALVVTRRDVHALNGLVFVNADSDVDVVVNGNLREIAIRCLMVWKEEHGRWRLFRFHASPIPRSGSGS